MQGGDQQEHPPKRTVRSTRGNVGRSTQEGVMDRMFRYLKNQKGATAVEYGIMVGLIAAIIIAIVVILGTKTNQAFNYTQSAMTGAPWGGS